VESPDWRAEVRAGAGGEGEGDNSRSKRDRGFTLEQSSEQMREMVKKRRMEVMEELVDVDRLREKLSWLGEVCRDGCVVCWAQKGDDARAWKGVRWQECREHSRRSMGEMERVMEEMKGVQPERFSGCTYCWAPQSVCQRWEEKTQAI